MPDIEPATSTVKDYLNVTLDKLNLTIVDETDDNKEYIVHIDKSGTDYVIEVYYNNQLQISYTVSNKGYVYGNQETFQNNQILVRAYNILFNYYLITNMVRNKDVILENTSDKFLIKAINTLQVDYGNPYHIDLAPNPNP